VPDATVLARAEQLRSTRTPFVLATVVRVERPSSARPGDQALVLPDGTMEGFVGGVCAESTTRAEALRLLDAGEPGMLRITPGGGPDDLASGLHVVENPCLSGGTVDLFLEPVLPALLVVVLGDGPVARALVRVGAALEHDVRLIDDPGAGLPADTAAVVIAAHGRGEAALLAAALRAQVPYVALVASPRRAKGILAELPDHGVDADLAARVSAPAGLDIGARTPPEIAVSVYAEMVERRIRPGEPVLLRGQGRATDPVCGMAVAAVAASLHVEHGGAPVWFCGPGCRDAFVAEPARYAQ
jgi:xanthine dehydrogenase accessory factor